MFIQQEMRECFILKREIFQVTSFDRMGISFKPPIGISLPDIWSLPHQLLSRDVFKANYDHHCYNICTQSPWTRRAIHTAKHHVSNQILKIFESCS